MLYGTKRFGVQSSRVGRNEVETHRFEMVGFAIALPTLRFNAIKLRADTQVCPYKTPRIIIL
ncbi:MAG: hypothetical protein KAI83_12960 [Thiomargarita sp.]|nr:hypothetical protein [Thiomargarita sp.]